MTYSIIGRDPATGAIGGAVQSKFPGVGSVVPHGDARAGMVHTQAFANPDHGTDGLDLMRLGATPEEALAILTRGDAHRDERQVALMDTAGGAATHTGSAIAGWQGASGAETGENAVAIGNSLADETVLPAMIRAFETGYGDLSDRLVAALRAGRDAGGEIRGLQAAALRVVQAGAGYGGRAGTLVDIQIYDHAMPIEELARCLALHRLSYFASDPDDLVAIDAATARYLGRLLAQQGHLDRPGDDGSWEAPEIAAMARFMGQENYDNRIRDDALIDKRVLADIEARFGKP